MTQESRAADGPGETDAPISGVTVFRDGARVTRAGRLDVRAGLHRARAAVLPGAADPASVRVAVRGAGVALLEVEVGQRFAAVPTREEPARLREEVEKRKDAVKELTDEDAAEAAGLDFLGHLSESAAVWLARAVSGGRADYAELTRMAGHLTGGTASALGRRREIASRLRTARRELEAAEQRLAAAERRKGRTEQFHEVSVVLEAAAAVSAEIDVSYHVCGASWQPLYDLTLNGEKLAIAYLAEVTQHTGEDWPQTRLVLSTARQGEQQGLPELSPWYIGRPVLPHPRKESLRARSLAASEESAIVGGVPPLPAQAAYGAVPAAPGQAPDLTAEVVQPGESGAGIAYTVALPVAVPADGGPHKTTVAKFEADAVLDYLTVPVVAAEAYLRATVTNGPLLLLPGTARVFHGPQFVGKTDLDTVAAGEEFEVQLGVDDQIRVERKLTRRSTSKAVLGGTRTIDIAYEITVENHRIGKAKVSVHDHIPLSRDAEIKVKPREAAPVPAKTDDLGELTWELSLDGGTSATIKHRFTVEHPAGVTVTGL
jgi:uncharacterized protein (TIGR02231 family)